MKPTLLVLAAGMGSRYGGLKQLDRLGPSDETITDYSIYDAIKAGFGKVVFVIRKSFEKEFKEAFVDNLKDKIEIELVFQELDNLPAGVSTFDEREKPWGTGHAIWVAKEAISTPFAVINADDFYGANAFKVMADFLISKENSKGEYSMCGYMLGNTLSKFGSVSRGVCKVKDGNMLESVDELTKISQASDGNIFNDDNGSKTPLTGKEYVSMNFWGFTNDIFAHLQEKFILFMNEKGRELKSEFYIPFVVDELMHEGKASTEVLPCNAKWFGVTYKEDKENAVSELKSLVEQGLYPENLWA